MTKGSYNAVDSAGNTVFAVHATDADIGKAQSAVYLYWPRVGLACSANSNTLKGYEDQATGDIILGNFAVNNLRPCTICGGTDSQKAARSKIAKTHLCSSATAPAQCNPQSPGYIASFVFDIQDTLKQIIVAGHTYSNMDTCNKDILYSPLVIEDNPGHGITTLDPKATNTYFDLIGDGTKSRISCVQDGAFLVLPDRQGQIVNINQLFGDNTVGPDGNKADNGFLALEKYDANGDGVIDKRDPVFRSLQLWHDRNCDGQAQVDELEPISAMGIAAIDAAGYKHMHETDPWGNVTKQRSLVHLSGGQVRKIFDLWFKVSN